MKKTARTYMLIILAAVMAFAMCFAAGCGGGAGTEETEAESTQAANQGAVTIEFDMPEPGKAAREIEDSVVVTIDGRSMDIIGVNWSMVMGDDSEITEFENENTYFMYIIFGTPDEWDETTEIDWTIPEGAFFSSCGINEENQFYVVLSITVDVEEAETAAPQQPARPQQPVQPPAQPQPQAHTVHNYTAGCTGDEAQNTHYNVCECGDTMSIKQGLYVTSEGTMFHTFTCPLCGYELHDSHTYNEDLMTCIVCEHHEHWAVTYSALSAEGGSDYDGHRVNCVCGESWTEGHYFEYEHYEMCRCGYGDPNIYPDPWNTGH